MKDNQRVTILGIESSCDETAAAVLVAEGVDLRLLSNVVSSQIKIHAEFGGVVPEVAARHHTQNVLPVITEALQTAKVNKADIDVLAATAGPGLITSLLVGVQAAKTLSYLWQKPLIPVNHLQAHIAANFAQSLNFPALALIVSGGHTELVLVKDHNKFIKIGQTRDDAVGEAFDKVAKILNLGYPGGPIVSRLAKLGDRDKFSFPRPMLKDNNLDFSFSGLKTSVLYLTKHPEIQSELSKENVSPENNPIVCDLCASFQQAAVEVLVAKAIKAAKKYQVKAVILAGGVAANAELRRQLGEAVADQLSASYLIPDFALCTDNAGMIALAAYYQVQKFGLKKFQSGWKNLKVNANWEI